MIGVLNSLDSVSIIPDVRIRLSVSMIFAGTAMFAIGVGYLAWMNRPKARFMKLYPEVVQLRLDHVAFKVASPDWIELDSRVGR